MSRGSFLRNAKWQSGAPADLFDTAQGPIVIQFTDGTTYCVGDCTRFDVTRLIEELNVGIARHAVLFDHTLRQAKQRNGNGGKPATESLNKEGRDRLYTQFVDVLIERCPKLRTLDKAKVYDFTAADGIWLNRLLTKRGVTWVVENWPAAVKKYCAHSNGQLTIKNLCSRIDLVLTWSEERYRGESGFKRPAQYVEPNFGVAKPSAAYMAAQKRNGNGNK